MWKDILDAQTHLGPCLLPASAQWQQVTAPSAAEAAAAFRTPPAGFGMLLWWSWGGPITREFIVRDLDNIHSHGVAGVLIGTAYGVDPPYLSPRFFELIRYAVDQAKQRGMKVWLADEGTYPSGFAGGKFNTDHPALRMQALVVSDRLMAAGGEEVRHALPPETVGVLAVNRATGQSQVIAGGGAGELRWRAPDGNWLVFIVRHDFRTSPTRYVNNPRPVKSTEYSLCDYLDPEAIRTFWPTCTSNTRNTSAASLAKPWLGSSAMNPIIPCRESPGRRASSTSSSGGKATTSGPGSRSSSARSLPKRRGLRWPITGMCGAICFATRSFASRPSGAPATAWRTWST